MKKCFHGNANKHMALWISTRPVAYMTIAIHIESRGSIYKIQYIFVNKKTIE